MTWEEICDDPALRDLPFKVETNQRGQYVMSPPPRSEHGEYQSTIAFLLKQLLPHGKCVTECPVQTAAGVRVPDVVWTSLARRQPVIYKLAPEICVEVISPHNDEEEMLEKRSLYFAAGALEVWLCAQDGRMTFYRADGVSAAGSLFCPAFPPRVEI